MNFQKPATLVMDSIIDLHHDIATFLVIITTFVFYMFSYIFYFFRRSAESVSVKRQHINHNAPLEIV